MRIQRGRAHSACACFQRSRRVLGSVSVDKLLDTAHHIGSIERAHGRKFDPGRMELLIRKNPGCECPRTVGVAITDKNGFLDAFPTLELVRVRLLPPDPPDANSVRKLAATWVRRQPEYCWRVAMAKRLG